MKMKKSILCLLLVLSLCLCMIFASCKPDEVDESTGEKLGQVHTTPDTSAGVEPDLPNQSVDGFTNRH